MQRLIGKCEGNMYFRRGMSVDGRIILKCVLNRTGGFELFFVVREGDGWYLFCTW